jgi:hypothetical protein
MISDWRETTHSLANDRRDGTPLGTSCKRLEKGTCTRYRPDSRSSEINFKFLKEHLRANYRDADHIATDLQGLLEHAGHTLRFDARCLACSRYTLIPLLTCH